MSNPKVMAYRRENGRVGIRNHVLILPLDDLSNSACEKVAFNTGGIDGYVCLRCIDADVKNYIHLTRISKRNVYVNDKRAMFIRNEMGHSVVIPILDPLRIDEIHRL